MRFTVDHKQRRFDTGIAYEQANLHIAELLRKKIQQDIKGGIYDETHNVYRKMLEDRIYYKTAVEDPDQVYNLASLYNDYVAHQKKKRVFTGNEIPVNYVSAHNMLKRWGAVKLTEVEDKLWGMEYSPSTHNNRLTNLLNFFNWGVKVGVFAANPILETQKLKGKKQKDRSREPLSKEEVERIILAMETDEFCKKSSRFKHSYYVPFFKFMVLTGVRNAEAIGLTVEKVNFTRRTITIDEVLARTNNTSNAKSRKRKETKTGNSRVLPMNQELYDLLVQSCRGKSGDQLVFQSVKGLAIDDKMFQRRVFQPVLKALGIPRRVLYSLRHSFAERALLQGMNPYEVATLMGHSSIETTFRNYVHLTQNPKNLPDL